MAARSTSEVEQVRLNDLDWELLEILADGRRYTPAYLYNDLDELSAYDDGWIRQRLGHLRDLGLIERVGTSSMYEISDWGRAALELRDEYEDTTPKSFAQLVMKRARDD
jgi:hypothetical protein